MSNSATYDPEARTPLVLGDKSFQDVSNIICKPLEQPLIKTPPWWLIGITLSLALLGMLGSVIGYLMWEGIGVWGNNTTVAWGYDIINFVWWIGIAHAGTAISAILFLFRQNWKASINRLAEAMTVFSVFCALIYPGIHVGRAWMAYYLFPLPNQMGMWPNFRSPLLWDFAAVSTYGTVSALFWYLGLIPDLATIRDRATNNVRKILYGIFAMGWRGASRQWIHYEKAYLLLAAVATPMVISVCTIVSFDFATANLPGWHATIFPPYFVTGAIFSGFALVTALLIITREVFGFKEMVTMHHIDNLCKVMLAMGLFVCYIYGIEIFMAWYGANSYERFTFWNRAFGPFGWAFWIMFTFNVVSTQLLWFKKIRQNLWIIFAITLVILVGMWFERFVIMVTLHAGFLPSSWGYYRPSIIDVLTYVGTFGLFATLFLLFLRFLPQIAISEVKAILPQAKPLHGHHGNTHG